MSELKKLTRLRRVLKQLDPPLNIEEKISSLDFLDNFHAETMARVLASQKKYAIARELVSIELGERA